MRRFFLSLFIATIISACASGGSHSSDSAVLNPCKDAPATAKNEIAVRLVNKSPTRTRLYIHPGPTKRGGVLTGSVRPINEDYAVVSRGLLNRNYWIRLQPRGTWHADVVKGKANAPMGSQITAGVYQFMMPGPAISLSDDCARIRIKDDIKHSTITVW